MYLLDTHVVSELRKGRAGRAHKGVVTWAQAVATDSLHLSVITIMELELGIRRVAQKDPVQSDMLRRWLDEQVIPAFAGRILPIDVAVAQCCAGLHIPDPRSERDAFIAATGIIHSMTVVTRNTLDFELTGVKLLNPWL